MTASIVIPNDRPVASLIAPRTSGASAPIANPVIIITPEAEEWYFSGTTS